MKFFDTHSEYLYFKDVIDISLREVLESGIYLLGSQAKKLEKEFAEYLGVKSAVSVKNATDAITMIVKHLWRPGMPVILPNFGAYPTAVAVRAAGVNPYDVRFVDVDRTMTMDTSKLPDLGDGIIIPVHLFGNNANLREIQSYAEHYNHWIIEDCAQSTGSQCGSWGHFSVFSFYPTKPLASMADGGMLCSTCFTDEEMDLFRSLRFYGQKTRGTIDFPNGVNSRMDEWQSAIVRAKLPFFEQFNERRRKNADRFLSIVQGIDWDPESVFHQFPILFKERDKVRQIFEDRGIPTLIHYEQHVSETPGCAYTGKLRGQDQVGYRVNDKILSIPVHPFLEEDDVQLIEETLEQVKDYEIVE